jgi:prephenate dehydratase
MTTVAFQGERGAYSEEAVYRLFGPEAVPLPVRDFAGVGRAVASGEADGAVLPVENTLAGAVVASLDVLGTPELDLRVVGEAVIPIRHCVLALPGVALESLVRIRSHPVALAQCTLFFERTGLEAVASYDTAGAAKEVRALGDPTVAAIAGDGAASRYGLEVVASGIADRPDNQTRFLAVRQSTEVIAIGPADKALLVAQVANVPGALVRLLSIFAERGINLSRLDARPGTQPWTHRFFIEVEIDPDSPLGRETLAEAATATLTLRCLGGYSAGPV